MSPEPAAGAIPSITYSGPAEIVSVNKYHFCLKWERYARRPRPHGEWCLIPFSMFLGLLVSYLGITFKEVFHIGPAVWEAVVMLLMAVTLVSSVLLFGA